MFGAFGKGLNSSVIFVSRAGFESPALQKLKLTKPLVAVKSTRKLRKKDMIHNHWQPKIDVDPETYQVRADGELLVCEAAQELPLAQRYFLF
jgi:urease subunit alpha